MSGPPGEEFAQRIDRRADRPLARLGVLQAHARSRALGLLAFWLWLPRASRSPGATGSERTSGPACVATPTGCTGGNAGTGAAVRARVRRAAALPVAAVPAERPAAGARRLAAEPLAAERPGQPEAAPGRQAAGSTGWRRPARRLRRGLGSLRRRRRRRGDLGRRARRAAPCRATPGAAAAPEARLPRPPRPSAPRWRRSRTACPFRRNLHARGAAMRHACAAVAAILGPSRVPGRPQANCARANRASRRP